MAALWADGLWASGLWDPGLWMQAGNVPVITTTSLPYGAVGVGYFQAIQAGGDLPITFAVTVGVLPDGLTLSSAGVLSGTPTTEESQTFTVEATNPQGTDTQEYTVAIGVAAAGTGAARDSYRRMGRGFLKPGGRG